MLLALGVEGGVPCLPSWLLLSRLGRPQRAGFRSRPQTCNACCALFSSCRAQS